jgi:hypothetical protein
MNPHLYAAIAALLSSLSTILVAYFLRRPD